MPTLEENLRIRTLLRSDLSRASAAVTPERPRSLLRGGAAVRSIRLPSGALIKPLAAADLALPGATAPRVTLWPWGLNKSNLVEGKSVVRSPEFTGPAVIDRIALSWQNWDGGLTDGLIILWGADVPATSVDGTTSDYSTAGGTHLFLPFVNGTGFAFTLDQPEGYFGVGNQGTKTLSEYTVKRLVTLDKFRIGIALVSTGVGPNVDGWVRVIEAIDPDTYDPF